MWRQGRQSCGWPLARYCWVSEKRCIRANHLDSRSGPRRLLRTAQQQSKTQRNCPRTETLKPAVFKHHRKRAPRTCQRRRMATQFRISVKREDAPAGHLDIAPGTVSTFLHRHVGEGDTVLVHTQEARMCSMRVAQTGWCSSAGARESLQYSACSTTSPGTLIAKFCGYTQHSRDSDSFAATVRALAASRSGIRCVTLYETIGPTDVQGRDYDAPGRISVELLPRISL